MHLYIKQKIFSWADSFSVKDVNGSILYSVVGKIISITKKLTIYQNEQEVARIEKKLISLMPKFYVYAGGNQIAEIKKQISLLHPKYTVEGLDWKIEGDVWSHNYEITKRGQVIATIHKKWVSWGDAYELNISDNVDQIIALAVIIAIDCVAGDKN
ncbi:MAG: LURP-one-related family protein [Treponema sp.]|nr:LURP-one-related family protein [Treponema sp.]